MDMPRKPRFFLPNVPVHIIIRGNSRKAIFAEAGDYLAYLALLKEGASTHECQIHAYVLMTNHVHLLISADNPQNLSKLPQYVGRKYVPFFNHKYGCSGTLWEGRFKASSIDSDRYLLTCQRYIELNPVRANMVENPAEYRWSSYVANAYGKIDPLLTPHPLYLALGQDNEQCARCYRESFREVLDSSLIGEIEASVQTGTPLGNERFKADIERLLEVKVGQSRRGRPNKTVKGTDPF
ncbi:MAG: transposase [Candidatus Sedimenticola sp. (ex Thyasira tokunagai)]